MPSDWLHLSDDERVLWLTHPSIYTQLPGALVGAGLLAIGGAFALSGALENVQLGPVEGSVALLGLVPLALLAILPDHLRRTSTYYVVTDRQVVRKSGIVRRDVDPIRLDQIADIEYTQSIWGRPLAIGDVQIMTPGTGGADMTLRNVPHIYEFTRLLSGELDARRPSHPEPSTVPGS
jgi:uncharacterized membrane protein YdbT with pleckstrin-like domain